MDKLIDGGRGFSIDALLYGHHLPPHILHLIFPKLRGMNPLPRLKNSARLLELRYRGTPYFILLYLTAITAPVGRDVRSPLSHFLVVRLTPLSSQLLYDFSILLHEQLYARH